MNDNLEFRIQNSELSENYPIILVSLDIKAQEKFIDNFIKENKILPYLIFRVKPVKDEISIGQIREIKKDIIIYNKSKRLFVLYSFDIASNEAQNALLKTLEESINNNQFILSAANINQVLPTIQSRSRIVFLDKKENKKIKPEILRCIETSKQSKDYLFLADKEIIGINKVGAIVLIDQLLNYFKEKLVDEAKFAPKIIRQCLRIRRLIQDNNLNPQLTIDNLLIFINKVYNIKI